MASSNHDNPTPTHELSLLERLSGPHEWGYRDVADGTFIPDNTPFDAAAEIERLCAELTKLTGQTP